MDPMDDLVQFLRARLDEDEREARAAMWDEQSDVWTARPPQARYEQYIVADYCDDGVVVVTPENADPDGVGRHIARHDPARVLVEVNAKRRALDHYQAVRTHAKGSEPYILAEGAVRKQIQIMALPYADHPDYQETWKP